MSGDPRLLLADQVSLLQALRDWQASLPRICRVVSTQVTRAMTTPTVLFTIPAGSEGHLVIVHGEVGSDAGLTAALDLGRNANPTMLVSGHSVLGAAGVGQHLPVARKLGVVSAADIAVTGRYAETGNPSTVGGPWTVTILYSAGGN